MIFPSSFRVLIIILVSVNFNIDEVDSANILFLLPIATKSHKNVFDPLITALADRNHSITVVAPVKFKNPLENVREIVPITLEDINPLFLQGDPFEKRKEGKFAFLLNWNDSFIRSGCDKLYHNEEIREILKGGPGSFDVIIVNMFMNACALGIVHTLQAPHIYLATMPPMNFLVRKTGLYLPTSFVPNSFATFSDEMTFKQRVVNFLLEHVMMVMGELMGDYYSKMYQDHLGEQVPGISDIDKNVSLILMNAHFSLTYPRPALPDVVEVGGMFTRPAKALPKDLNEFVSSAPDGFIYFSLGSIVQAKDMSAEMQAKFLNVFSRLKQKVLWKWEGEIPSNLPPNVKLSKWLPQQDILGHPNIRLFITHGGLLSTQEAVYHGAPLIGFPLFADQDLNMIQAEKAGFAKTLEINEFTEDTLEHAINQVLTDSRISKRSKQLSSVFRDQPHRPIDTAVYWVEYIIRHKGAPHLRSAARELNFFTYQSIDVIVFLASIVIIILWLIKKLLVLLLKLLFGKRVATSPKKKVKRN